MKIAYGDYKKGDVSVNNLNFDALDKMEEVYQSYCEKIQSAYNGEERTEYLNKLEDAYETIFTDKILNPVKGAYDDKFSYFEFGNDIQIYSGSKETVVREASKNLVRAAACKEQYEALWEGTKCFYDLADDVSSWHDTVKVRKALKDSMHVYSSIKDIKTDSSNYLSAKAEADKIAKEISDRYAESHKYYLNEKDVKTGLKKEEKGITLNEILNAEVQMDSSGKYMIDLKKFADSTGL